MLSSLSSPFCQSLFWATTPFSFSQHPAFSILLKKWVNNVNTRNHHYRTQFWWRKKTLICSFYHPVVLGNEGNFMWQDFREWFSLFQIINSRLMCDWRNNFDKGKHQRKKVATFFQSFYWTPFLQTWQTKWIPNLQTQTWRTAPKSLSTTLSTVMKFIRIFMKAS